jgi:AraC-like DNA-binding protein
VAYATGFESPANFNHMFKRYTGITPSEHKASQRSEKVETVPVRRNGKSHSPLNGYPKLAKRWQGSGRSNSELVTV